MHYVRPFNDGSGRSRRNGNRWPDGCVVSADRISDKADSEPFIIIGPYGKGMPMSISKTSLAKTRIKCRKSSSQSEAATLVN